MKGKNLVNVVLSLAEEEYDFVFRSLSISPKDERLACLLSAIRKHGTVNRSLLAKHCNLSERMVRETTPTLGKELTFWLGAYERDQPIELEMALSTAWKLVFRIQNSAAGEVLQDLYTKAGECDRFDIMMEVWKLVEIMTESAEIEGISKEEVIQVHLNLLKYQELKAKADQLKVLPKERHGSMLKLFESTNLLSDEEAAKSISAKAHFYWIWTRIHYAKENFEGVVFCQENLISLIAKYPWLDRYDGFFFAKEHRPLITALVTKNLTTEAFDMLFRVGSLETTYPLTEVSKWSQIYPLKLAMAIDHGDWQKAKDCTIEIESIIATEGSYLSSKFVTQSLYYCAYFNFINGDYPLAKKIVNRLSVIYYPSDFYPTIAPMLRVLSAFLAFEDGDLEELLLVDKKFRSTNSFDEAAYYPFTLNALKRILRLANENLVSNELMETKIQFYDTLEESSSIGANRRFDFLKWMESKLTRRPMAEFFYHQASSNSKSEKKKRRIND
jgi:hypothetical protein